MTPVTCSVCKAPFAVYGVEPPLEYVCAECTDPLGGPPVLSPLEERLAALERFAAEVGPVVAELSQAVSLMGGSFL